jgi:hypothetical protein
MIPVVLMLLALAGKAQYSLTFCENVSPEGKAQMPSNSFMITKEGGLMTLLLKSDEKIPSQDLDFKIFYINDNGKEEEISKISQKIEPGWNYVWKELVFFDPGNYRVKAYSSTGTYLTSANLNLKEQ